MTNYNTTHIQAIFRCVFIGILANLVSGPKSNPGLLLVFVEIMPDKVILDQKNHIWSFFCVFFTYGQFLLKIEKNEIFQNLPNINFYGLK